MRLRPARAVRLDLERVNHRSLLRFLALRYRARSYLEIGVADGYAMFRVPARRKVGVDPEPRVTWRSRLRHAPANAWNLTVRVEHATSDEFFGRSAGESFDLIFVDGQHMYEQALRDIRSAVTFLSPRGLVVVHDTNPADAAEAWPGEQHEVAANPPPGWRGRWCGDVWKAIVAFRLTAPDVGVVTLAGDHGMTIVNPRIEGDPLVLVDGDLETLDFSHFDRNRETWLSLRDPGALERWLARDPALVDGDGKPE